MDTIILVDFSWLYYRSRYAHKELSTNIDGVTYGTGTIHGVYQTLSDIFHYHEDAYVMLCTDGEPVKHKMIDPDYKGQRDHKKESDVVQLSRFEIAKQFTVIPRVVIAHAPDMEADETIAFFAYMKKESEEVIILSSDGDLRQLINQRNNIFCSTGISSDEGVGLFKENEETLFKNGPKGLEGLSPQAIPMYLAITGDASDNIKGIPRYKKALAKTIANEAPTLAKLEAFLEMPATRGTKSSKAFDTLRNNMDLVKSNYALTKLDPISLPLIMDSYTDTSIDFFTHYQCLQAKAGIEKLIAKQP